MKSIAIIGFGRFGELLASLANTHFTVSIIESDPIKIDKARLKNYAVLDITQLSTVDYIFLSVPISSFETVVREITPHIQPHQVVIDLCSVKVYPVKIMKQYFGSAQLLATHPMFGPDSAGKGLDGLQVALCPINITENNLEIISGFWTDKGVTVIHTTAEAHDKDTAYSQAFTYSIANVINSTNIPDITFKTRSFKAIHEVAILSARDSEQLFHDMLFYNPYFVDMKHKLEKSFDQTLTKLDAIQEEQKLALLFERKLTGEI